jgi:hypothetical protein
VTTTAVSDKHRRLLFGVAGGIPVGAIGFHLADGRITVLRFVVNPDKLRGLQP